MKDYDHDSREREPRAGEYSIESAHLPQCKGLVSCYREGLQLMDFYRTPAMLYRDLPPVDKDKQYTKDTP